MKDEPTDENLKSTSEIQSRSQSYGPHRPTVAQFLELLKWIPQYLEVQAVAIKGQGGGVAIECYHDGADHLYHFSMSEDGKLEPTMEAP